VRWPGDADRPALRDEREDLLGGRVGLPGSGRPRSDRYGRRSDAASRTAVSQSSRPFCRVPPHKQPSQAARL
jgi:hypothetical protein